MKEHISYSQINASQCMKYYRDVYLSKIDNKSMCEGRFIHMLIDRYIKHCIDNNLDNDYDFMRNMFEFEIESKQKLHNKYKNIFNVIDMFAKNNLDIQNIYDVELEKEVIIDDIKLKVRFDMIKLYSQDDLNIIEITDFKNQRNITSEETLQMQIYRYAASKIWPEFDAIKINLFFCSIIKKYVVI